MPASLRRSRAERGFALVVVTALMLVVSLMALAITSGARLRAASLRNATDLLVAQSLAEAALDLAKLDLSRAQDDSRFRRDGRVNHLELPGGMATFSIQDERGKMDVNQQPVQHVAALIARAARQTGTPVSATALAARIRAARLTSVADLAGVPGVTPELYRALAPNVTVYIENPRVNVGHASEDVLLSLTSITPALVAQLQGARSAGLPRPSLGRGEAFATDEQGPAFTIVATGRIASGIEARIVEVVTVSGLNVASNRGTVRVAERR